MATLALRHGDKAVAVGLGFGLCGSAGRAAGPRGHVWTLSVASRGDNDSTCDCCSGADGHAGSRSDA